MTRFSIALAYNDPHHLLALAQAGEAAGFGSVILSDHLVYPEKLEPPTPTHVTVGQPFEPPPDTPIPIYAGGTSKPALRRAAERCDGWAGQIQSAAEMPGLIAQLSALRNASPLAGQSFGITTAVRDAYDEVD